MFEEEIHNNTVINWFSDLLYLQEKKLLIFLNTYNTY